MWNVPLLAKGPRMNFWEGKMLHPIFEHNKAQILIATCLGFARIVQARKSLTYRVDLTRKLSCSLQPRNGSHSQVRKYAPLRHAQLIVGSSSSNETDYGSAETPAAPRSMLKTEHQWRFKPYNEHGSASARVSINDARLHKTQAMKWRFNLRSRGWVRLGHNSYETELCSSQAHP